MQTVLHTQPSAIFSYQELFQKYLNLNPHTATCIELKKIAADHGCPDYDDKANLLDFLFSEIIQPNLQQPTFVHAFPVELALLAKINDNLAQRFEWFYRGLEVANGFNELNNAAEQEKRFLQNIKLRQEQNKTAPAIDYDFLKCLDKLPDCAGVAIGVDRLVMLALGAESISAVA